MAVKVIAIGNVIMGDDGAAIRVLENISNQLKDIGVECIIGETDFNYCISRINEGDFIFIIDAAYCGKNVGDITITSIEDSKTSKYDFSQHELSFLNMEYFGLKDVKGYIIGIEVDKIDFSLSLTRKMQDRLDEICINVKDIIERLVKTI
jgi:hydrogenase maturation protease